MGIKKMRFDGKEDEKRVLFSDPKDRIMRKKRRKAGVLSVALSGAMVVGLFSAVYVVKPATAEASKSLPAIEDIKTGLSGSGKSLRILEIVPDSESARFGFYVEGQEPFNIEKDVLLTAESEGLNGHAARKAAVDLLLKDSAKSDLLSNGIIAPENASEEEKATYPLNAVEGYREYYPWEKNVQTLIDNGLVKVIESEEEYTVNGGFRYSEDGTGSFDLAGPSYVIDTKNGEFQQDVPSGIDGIKSSFLKASDIKAGEKDRYMFYKPSFTEFYVDIRDINAEAVLYSDAENEHEITQNMDEYKGLYVFRAISGEDGESEPSSYEYFGTFGSIDAWEVSSYTEGAESYYFLDSFMADGTDPIPGEFNVTDPQGWYALSLDIPFKDDMKSSRYNNIFSIVPSSFVYRGEGKGKYEIQVYEVEGDSSYSVDYPDKVGFTPFTGAKISDNVIRYSLDIKNNNLFLKYVLDANDVSADQLSKMAASIQIDSVVAGDLLTTASETEITKIGQHYALGDYDLIVIEGGKYEKTLSDGVSEQILASALAKKAIIIDSSENAFSGAGGEAFSRILSSLQTKTEGYDLGYVDGNIFFFKPGTELRKHIVTKDITIAYADDYYKQNDDAFGSVYAEIVYENVLRNRAGMGESDMLPTTVNLGNVIRYILNYKQHRIQGKKSEIKILEIEPDNHSALRKSGIAYPDGKKNEDPDGNDYYDFVYGWFDGNYDDSNMTIATMSTYEFVGKVNDITEDYDLVYIGTDVTDFWTWDDKYVDVYTDAWRFNEGFGGYFIRNDARNNSKFVDIGYGAYPIVDEKVSIPHFKYDHTYYGSGYTTETYLKDELVTEVKVSHKTKFNDSEMDGLVYYNIGDLTYSGTERFKGLLSFEDTNVGGNRGQGDYRGGGPTDQIKNTNDANTNYFFDGLYLRFSGNDLTEKKLEELMDYAKSGYPVILADDLLQYYVTTGNLKTQVDTRKVDVNSRMYSLLSGIVDYENIFTSLSAGYSENRSSLMTALSFSKPYIEFDKNNGRPLDYSETASNHNQLGSDGLSFKFKIINPTDPAWNTSTYTVKLFIDQDGNSMMDEEAEEVSIGAVTGPNGRVEADNLLGGNSSETAGFYSFKQALPNTVQGMVTWELRIYQNNSSFHTSTKGYAYTPMKDIDGDGDSDPIEIKVLQINSDKEENYVAEGDPYNLQYYKQFKDLFAAIDGMYQIKVTTVQAGDVNNYYNGTTPGATECDINDNKGGNNNYDMLIIGFGDSYGNLSKVSTENIRDFVKSGKSILFSHDNTSVNNSYFLTEGGWTASDSKSKKGYYYNKYLRNLVGLDRYGITDTELHDGVRLGREVKEESSHQYYISYNDGILSGATNDVNNPYYLSESQIELIKSLGYEIAYKPKSVDPADVAAVNDVKGKTVIHTQGGTDLFLENLKAMHATPDGSVNQPYKYSNINVKNYDVYPEFLTWNPDGNSFSNGNYRTNTVTQVNEGQITKYPYAIDQNTSIGKYKERNGIEVASTHQQWLQLNMNGDDLIVWYCLGPRKTENGFSDDCYASMPNDAVNAYYIYTVGNVTYTGAGHSASYGWNSPITEMSEEEAQLFVNTIVASYRAKSAPPSIEYTAASTDDAGTVSTVVLNTEKVGHRAALLENNGSIEDADYSQLTGKVNFRFSDSNFASGKNLGFKEIRIEFPEVEMSSYMQNDQQLTKYKFDPLTIEIAEDGSVKIRGENRSQKKVRFLDSAGNEVQNWDFKAGKTYSIDMDSLMEVYEDFKSSLNQNGPQIPFYFPDRFDVYIKPATKFSDGTINEATDSSKLEIRTLKLFDIG